MAYITNQDIIDRVGTQTAAQLTTDSGSVPDQDVLDEVRLSAEGEVNGYLGKRYKVPVDLTDHPGVEGTLKGFTLDVAVYHLQTRRPPVAEAYKKLYDDAIKWCVAAGKGGVVLPAESTPASTTSDDPKPEWGSKDKNADTLREW